MREEGESAVLDHLISQFDGYRIWDLLQKFISGHYGTQVLGAIWGTGEGSWHSYLEGRIYQLLHK